MNNPDSPESLRESENTATADTAEEQPSDFEVSVAEVGDKTALTITLHIDTNSRGIEQCLQDIAMQQVLRLTGRNREKTSAMLGIGIRTLHDRVKSRGYRGRRAEEPEHPIRSISQAEETVEVAPDDPSTARPHTSETIAA